MKDAKNPEYVSKPRLEYNAQMWVLLYGLWRLQQLATGMNFWLPWLDATGKLLTILFPILFFMGDTPAHDKLCCLHIHPKAQFICRMCNISRENLDVPAKPYELWDMHLLKGLLCNENYESIKKMVYYPCKQNILLELQYCNGMGLNQAMPPEGLHVILIGYFMCLIQGLSWSCKVKGTT